MARFIAIILTLGVAIPSSWWVYGQLASFFKGFVPIYGAGIAGLLVFFLVFFLLLKPLVTHLADTFFWVAQGSKHVRRGAGLGEIPRAPTLRKSSMTPAVRASLSPQPPPRQVPPNPDATCRFCGAKGAEVCAACAKEWNIPEQ